MKDSKFTKLIAVISALVLLVGATLGITVLAEDSSVTDEPTAASVGIISTNINYAARLELVFAVSAEGLDDNAEVVMLFFKADPEAEGELTAGELYNKAYYRKTAASGTQNVNGVDALIFTSRGIAATEAASSFYAVPVIRYTDGEGAATYERGYTRRTESADGYIYEYGARKCGIELYAVQKLIGETKPTEAQEALYNSIIDYAKATTVRFGKTYTPDYSFVKVSGTTGLGVFDNGLYNDVSAMGEKLSFTAPKLNAAGIPFDYWLASDGSKVSNFNLEVAITAGMVEEYKAVYGANRYTVDFNDVALGSYTIPSYSNPPKDAWITNGGGAANPTIIDKGNGDHALQLSSEKNVSGYGIRFYPDSVSSSNTGVTSISFDLDYTVCNNNSTNGAIFNLILTDGTNTADIRFNPYMSKSIKGASYIYIEGVTKSDDPNFRALEDENGNRSVSFADTNVAIVYNSETIALEFYFGGKLFDSITLEECTVPYLNATQNTATNATKGNNIKKLIASATEGKQLSIVYFNIGCFKSTSDTIVVDNIVFDDQFYLAN